MLLENDKNKKPTIIKLADFGLSKEFVDDYYKAGGKGSYKEGNPTAGVYKNGIASMVYKRIFIRNKHPEVNLIAK